MGRVNRGTHNFVDVTFPGSIPLIGAGSGIDAHALRVLVGSKVDSGELAGRLVYTGPAGDDRRGWGELSEMERVEAIGWVRNKIAELLGGYKTPSKL